MLGIKLAIGSRSQNVFPLTLFLGEVLVTDEVFWTMPLRIRGSSAVLLLLVSK